MDTFTDQTEPIINDPRIKLSATREETPHQLEINQLITEANRLGFQLIKPNALYQVESSNGNIFYVYLFQNEPKTTHLALYDNEMLEKPIFDIMQFYQDKTIKGISTSPFTGLPYPKNIQSTNMQGATLQQALQYVRTKISNDGIGTLSPASVVKSIEQVYAIQQDYLIHINFADLDYLRKQAERNIMDIEVTDELVKDMQERMYAGYEFTIPEVVVDRYLRDNKVDAITWQEYENNITIIHERQTADKIWEKDLKCYFVELDYDRKQKKTIETPFVNITTMEKLAALKAQLMNQPFDYFSAVTKLLPPECEVKKIGDVSYPLKSELYYIVQN